jgi:hypothetical protein
MLLCVQTAQSNNDAVKSAVRIQVGSALEQQLVGMQVSVFCIWAIGLQTLSAVAQRGRFNL